MDWEVLAALGVRLKWYPHRIESVAGIAPRDIGRVVSFELDSGDDEDHFEGDRVMGILEGYLGNRIFVSGEEYRFADLANVKVWNKGVANGRD